MKDSEQLIIIDSIKKDQEIDATLKIDLIRKLMNDCREKKVGKILIEAIEKKTKKIKEETQPKKRGRGRPRKTEVKEISENAKKMIESARERDANKE